MGRGLEHVANCDSLGLDVDVICAVRYKRGSWGHDSQNILTGRQMPIETFLKLLA